MEQSSNQSANVSPVVAAAVIFSIVGAAAGYYTRYMTSSDNTGRLFGERPAVAMGTGGIPDGGGGRGGPPSGGAALARLVRNLDMIQKVQGKGLTGTQEKTLLVVLQKIKGTEKLPDAEADKQTEAIQKVLTTDQKQVLAGLQPRGGGQGGGFGGPPQDPDRPFASERNQQALDNLIAEVSKP